MSNDNVGAEQLLRLQQQTSDKRSPPRRPLSPQQWLNPFWPEEEEQTFGTSTKTNSSDFQDAQSSEPDEQENNRSRPASPLEQEVAMSASTLIERLKVDSVQGKIKRPSRKTNEPVFDDEQLEHVHKFIHMLKKTDRELAYELSQVFQSMSDPRFAAKTRANFDEETVAALECFVDFVADHARAGYDETTLQTSLAQCSVPSKDLSLKTRDLDRETLTALRYYIDALANSPTRRQQTTKRPSGKKNSAKPTTLHLPNDTTFGSSGEAALDQETLAVLEQYIDTVASPRKGTKDTSETVPPTLSTDSQPFDEKRNRRYVGFRYGGEEGSSISSLPPAAAAVAASLKADRKIRKDPPSETTDGSSSRAEDPPLALSLSAEAARQSSKPERNPNKQSNKKKPAPELLARKPRFTDPDDGESADIQFDMSGELNPPKPSVSEEVPMDEGIETKVDGKDEEEGDAMGESNELEEEKKEEVPELSIEDTWKPSDGPWKRLWNNFEQGENNARQEYSEKKYNKEFTLENFSQLVKVAFPFFDGKEPDATAIAHLQVQARRKNVPVAMTDAFLPSITNLSDAEASLELTPLHPSLRKLSESEDEAARREAWIMRVSNVMEAQRRRGVLIYSTADSRDYEAVEVDLNGDFGFSFKDYSETDLSDDDENWWEAAAKLGKVVAQSRNADDLDPPAPSDAETAGSNASEGGKVSKASGRGVDPSVKGVSSVEESIKGHWKEREAAKSKSIHHYQPRRSRRLPNSFSLTDNEQTTASASSFSSMRTMDYDEEELWIRKRDMALWPKTVEDSGWITHESSAPPPEPIDAVATAAYFRRPAFLMRRNNPGTVQWKQPYVSRTKPHEGYFDVDVQSLYMSTAIRAFRHQLDCQPWEYREVKQRFLHEQSVSYTRNWFGTARKVYGNDKLQQPVCRPKSMEMPMKAGEWTEEWYANPWSNPSPAASVGSADDELKEIQQIRRRYKIGDEFDDDFDDTSSWEETPECGTFKNVKLKIGERITLVTPELTSSLRRSRWRKKYFPKGTFPY